MDDICITVWGFAVALCVVPCDYIVIAMNPFIYLLGLWCGYATFIVIGSTGNVISIGNAVSLIIESSLLTLEINVDVFIE